MIGALENIVNKVSNALEFNKATLSGAVDVIAVQYDDGTFQSSPFHVRFGKLKVLKSKEEVISLYINDEDVPVKMKLAVTGQGFFQIPKKHTHRRRKKNREDSNLDNASSFGGSDYNSGSDFEGSGNASPTNRSQNKKSKWRWLFGENKQKLEKAIQESKHSADKKQKERDDKRSLFKSFLGIFSKNDKKGKEKELDNIDAKSENNDEMRREESQYSNVLRKKSENFDLEDKDSLFSPEDNSFHRESSINQESPGIKKTETILLSPQQGEAETTLPELIQQDLADFPPMNQDEECSIEMSLCGHLIDGIDENQLLDVFMTQKVTSDEFQKDPVGILTSPNLLIKIDDSLYESKAAIPLIISLLAYKKPLPESVLDDIILAKNQKSIWTDIWGNTKTKDLTDIKDKKEKIVFRSTLKPNSEILEKMNLKPGRNKITYSVKTSLQGIQQIDAYIFLYKPYTKFIISDIDGTITKTDVLGQLLPFVGKEWLQEGVAKFYNNLQRRLGYEILYLTARAIGQVNAQMLSLERTNKRTDL